MDIIEKLKQKLCTIKGVEGAYLTFYKLSEAIGYPEATIKLDKRGTLIKNIRLQHLIEQKKVFEVILETSHLAYGWTNIYLVRELETQELFLIAKDYVIFLNKEDENSVPFINSRR